MDGDTPWNGGQRCSNMTFALVGAFTVGTLDSANMAIRVDVGAENLLLHGLTVEQARELKLRGYRPGQSLKNAYLREILDFVRSDALAGGQPSPLPPVPRPLAVRR